tara:strand:+ start:5027 stop:5347 length:321 start_codon:yes stop_codon:yes gene_type:complete
MTEVLPLPIYPCKPTGDDLRLLRDAKDQVVTSVLVKPVNAVPGSPGRIIALREKPTWICEYAYIPTPNAQSMKAALEWALGVKEDARGVTVIRTLREIFGPEVREV